MLHLRDLVGEISLLGPQTIILHAIHNDVDLSPFTILAAIGRFVTDQVQVSQVRGDGRENLLDFIRLLDAIRDSARALAKLVQQFAESR